MRFVVIILSMVIFVTAPVPVAASEEPYCNIEIKNKSEHMNPFLDGVDKVVIVLDFFRYWYDEQYFDTHYHMKDYGKRLKQEIEGWLKPIPKETYDPYLSQTFECYYKDNRPVELLYLGIPRDPMDTEKYNNISKRPRTLIIYVKRVQKNWQQAKERSRKKFGELVDVSDTLSITAVVYRADSNLDPRESIIFTTPINNSEPGTPNAKIISDYTIKKIALGIFYR